MGTATAVAAAPSLWSEFDAELSKLTTEAKADIVALGKFFKPLVQAGAQELASAAMSAVLQQAPLVLTGAEKLSAATANIVTTLAASGKSVATGIAQAAAQAAYNKMSSLVPPVTAQPAAQAAKAS